MIPLLYMSDNCIQDYFDAVKCKPVMKDGEEQILGKKIFDKNALLDQQKESYTAEEVEAISQGMLAEKRFIEANLRLVVLIAKNYLYKNVELESLIQWGNIGLIVAVRKFDYRKGNKFSTIAYWWIKQAIGRGITNTGRMIRLPIHISDRLDKINRTKRKLTQSLKRNPTIEEIALSANLTIEEVSFALYSDRAMTSTNTIVDAVEQTELGEMISQEYSSNEYNNELEIHESIGLVLDSLEPFSRDLIKEYFGIDGKQKTAKQLCRQYQIDLETLERVITDTLQRIKQDNPSLVDLIVDT